MSKPTIDRITGRDETASVASLSAAFAAYPLFSHLAPDADQQPRVIESFCRFLFRAAVRARGAFATSDRAAVACAWPPGHEWPTTWDRARAGGLSLLWQLGWSSARRLLALERGFDDARRKHVPGPHWYVSLLGVRAEARGKGLSRVALAPILESADRDRVPVYLETMDERNVAIYERLGFTLVGRSELPGGLPNWELSREPI